MTGHVDGNALAGDLREAMGTEMTAARGRCRRCGNMTVLGELVVYLSAPSPVARCPHCAAVLFVVHRFRDPVQIRWGALELAEVR